MKKIVLALLLGVLAIGTVSSIGCNDTKETKKVTKTESTTK